MNICELITSTTIVHLAHIAAEKNINFNNSEMAAKMQATCKEWLPKILNEAIADAENADLLEGLKTNRIDPLVKYSFNVALKHGCYRYAQFLLGIEQVKG